MQIGGGTAAKRMMYLANRIINLQIEKENLQIVSSVLQIERQTATRIKKLQIECVNLQIES